jgi:Flp pilus assembly protein TadD
VLLLGAGIAGAAVHGGCAHGPHLTTGSKTAPPPAAPSATPAASRDAVPTVAVDLNRTAGEDVTFHKSATERQKFQVHIDFGKVFDAQGNLDRAIHEYQDALKVAEKRERGELNAADEALAHRRIASAFDRQGQFRQSEPHYRQAIKLAPKDPKVWNDAGYSYYLQGRWDDAEHSLRTALKLAPGDARARTNLGMVLGAAGKTEEALSLLSANQGDAVGHANLGFLLASTGRREQARREYQAALAMRPDLPVAQRALAQLDRLEGKITTPSAVAIARNDAPTHPVSRAPVDPAVARTSVLPSTRILEPPLPPLPPDGPPGPVRP